MPTEKSSKELHRSISDLRHSVSDLRRQLNTLNDEKEKAFSEKETLSKKIGELIAKVKELKGARDQMIGVIRNKKEERKELLQQISTKITLVKSVAVQIKGKHTSDRREKGPGFLKTEIERLEQSIETEVMSFDKEKEIMKKIKEMKKKLDAVQEQSTLGGRRRELSIEIDAVKEKANATHQEIQDLAKQSQEKHEQMLEVSKQIDEIKVQEDTAFKAFISKKNAFNEVNAKLKELLSELNKLDEQAIEHRQDFGEKKRKKEQLDLEDMESRVEEKIRRGEKLTTEDLIVFQGKKL